MGWAALLLLVMAALSFRLYDKYWRVPEPAPAPIVSTPLPKAVEPGPPLPLVTQKELQRLRRAARDANTPGERGNAYRMLISVRDPQASAIIADVLVRDPEPEIRLKAAALLFDTGDKPLMLKGFREALDDPEPSVRRIALELLDRIGDPAAAPRVAEAASSDSEPELRALALRVLGTLHERARADAEAKAARQREEYENAVKERQKRERM